MDDSFVSASGVPWVIRGHSVVQATVTDQGQDLSDILFCKRCGASVHSSARGLQGVCKGAKHQGLKTQRSKLRRGLFPGHSHGNATIGAAFGPTLQMRAVWGPLLEPSPAPAAAVSLDGEAVEGQGSAEASTLAGCVTPAPGGEVPEPGGAKALLPAWDPTSPGETDQNERAVRRKV